MIKLLPFNHGDKNFQNFKNLETTGQVLATLKSGSNVSFYLVRDIYQN